jgi:hypothetical protein
MAAVLERQERLATQLRELESARRSAENRAAQVATESVAHAGAAAAQQTRESWLGELRGAKNLRRAIVLREVLGTPVGLR